MYLKHCKSAMLIAQLWPTVCYPMDCSPPGFSVHGVLQARILEWIAILFLLGIFPTWGSSWGLPHCRQILYCLSHQGNPQISYTSKFVLKCDQFSPTIALTSLFSTEVNSPSQPFHRQLPLIILYSTVGPDWRVVK